MREFRFGIRPFENLVGNVSCQDILRLLRDIGVRKQVRVLPVQRQSVSVDNLLLNDPVFQSSADATQETACPAREIQAIIAEWGTRSVST